MGSHLGLAARTSWPLDISSRVQEGPVDTDVVDSVKGEDVNAHVKQHSTEAAHFVNCHAQSTI
jgi:hypothetical protein